MRDDHLVGEGRLFEPDVMLPVQYFAVLRKRGVAVVVGSALVPIAMFTHVLGYEAIPAAGLLALAGFIGPRPSGVARQSNVVAAPPTLEPDV